MIFVPSLPSCMSSSTVHFCAGSVLQRRCNSVPTPRGRCVGSPSTKRRVQVAAANAFGYAPVSWPLATVQPSILIADAGHALASQSFLLQAAFVVVLVAMAALAAFGPPAEDGSVVSVAPPEGVKRRKTPIVCVHGIAHGGWVYGEVAKKLASEGWTVHILTLRKNRFKTLSDFMDEIRGYVEKNIEEPPVLVGHSLGGMMVQQYLLNFDMEQPVSKRAKGAVFLATLRADSLADALRAVVSIVQQNLLGCLWGALRFNGRFVIGTTDDETQRLMFRAGTRGTNIAGEGYEDMGQYLQRLSALDSGIVTADWLRTVAAKPHKASPADVNLPTLSVIPADDALILPWTQRELAAAWGSEELCVEQQGHCLGDPGWEESYAAPLAAWLARTFD